MASASTAPAAVPCDMFCLTRQGLVMNSMTKTKWAKWNVSVGVAAGAVLAEAIHFNEHQVGWAVPILVILIKLLALNSCMQAAIFA